MYKRQPNDVLIGGRKVAGVLVETRHGKSPFAVVGVGLNVNHEKSDFPVELQERSESLAMASGIFFDRTQVASLLLKSLWQYEQLMRSTPEAVTDRFREMLFPAGFLSPS